MGSFNSDLNAPVTTGEKLHSNAEFLTAFSDPQSCLRT